MKAKLLAAWVALLAFGLPLFGEAPVLPQGIIPVPDEPPIVVSIKTDKATYAPGDPLRLTFTLNRDAYVYLYNLTVDGKVKLLVPNRFLQDPLFPAGTHTLPTQGWVLRVTAPEGIEYLQLVASAAPLSFYEAKAFEADAFLVYTNPAAFASQITALLPGTWGTAWASYRVHRPQATLSVATRPSGAAVWVGGSYVGTSPLSTSVAPGRIRVQVEKDGYEAKSVDLVVGDGEEVSLVVSLSPARPSLWPPVSPPSWTVDAELSAVGFGLAVGLTTRSISTDLWLEGFGFGISFQLAPPLPDLSEPGPGGWFAGGPEVEGYIAGWLPVGRAGFVVLVGVSLQEMAWVPPWSPSAALAPLVDIEPETRADVHLTGGAGFGVEGSGWRLYLSLHSRRGFVVGLTILP
jgi:hypothetical protein